MGLHCVLCWAALYNSSLAGEKQIVTNPPTNVAGDAAALLASGSQAPLIKTITRAPGGRIDLLLGGLDGVVYEVQASSNLQTWVPLALAQPPERLVTDWPTNLPSRFYRAVEGPVLWPPIPASLAGKGIRLTQPWQTAELLTLWSPTNFLSDVGGAFGEYTWITGTKDRSARFNANFLDGEVYVR